MEGTIMDGVSEKGVLDGVVLSLDSITVTNRIKAEAWNLKKEDPIEVEGYLISKSEKRDGFAMVRSMKTATGDAYYVFQRI